MSRKKAKKYQATRLNDGIQSLALNLGAKQQGLQYGSSQPISQTELEALWSENWIAKKICIKRAEDMTRRWREVYANELDAEQLDQFTRLERRLKLRETLCEALQWASLYGSVGVLIITDKPSLNTPLMATERIQKLVILPKEKINPQGEKERDVLSDNYGKYNVYTIANEVNVVEVHHSRLMILNAHNAPLSSQEIWGVSDLSPVIETLKRFDGASKNIGDLIFESKVDVFRIAGLSEKIASGMENDVARVIQAVQLIKSSTNSLVLDTENEYEQKELAFGGLKDLLTEFRNAVAGAADIPVTILFGQSVSGLASGDEDIQNYHESIHRLQEARLRPVFERLDPLLCNQLFGGLPEDWWFEFTPLKELTQEQQVNMLNTFSQAVNGLIQHGIVTEIQAANELKESGLFANISAEDLALLEQQYDPTAVDESARDFEKQPENQGAEI
ncbi:hypothetical protein A4G19_10575 [Pasteurellaceae bacterium Macca]|nr:hypothetical protein [Pasteurellaceae bacterium Macca]MCK3656168.1 hypothetical protein [Pasteurellaceae bacterium Macca]